MKRLVYLLISILIISCGVQDNDTIMESRIELFSLGKIDNPSYYIKATIINHTDQPYYLADVHRTFTLNIINDQGKNCNQEYLSAEPYAKGNLLLDTLLNYDSRDSVKYEKTISSAIEKHLVKQMNLNFLRSMDTIFSNGIKESLLGMYEDMVLIEPKDSVYNYYRINSLIQSGKKYDIIFNYKEKVHFPIMFGRLFVYEHIKGSDNKYFAVFSTNYLKTINGYMHYKRRIRSNQISINY